MSGEHRLADHVVGGVRRKLGTHATTRKDDDAVGQRTQLVEVGTHDDDGGSSPRRCEDLGVDRARRGEIDPTRGVRHQQHPRVPLFDPRDRPRDHELLLVPAGERPRHDRHVVGPLRTRGAGARFAIHRVGVEEAVPREASQLAEEHVVADRCVEDQTLLVAILVDDGDHIGRRGDAPAVDGIELGDRANDLALTVPLDARDADDLARAHLQADSAHGAPHPDVAQNEHGLSSPDRARPALEGSHALVAHDGSSERTHFVARARHVARLDDRSAPHHRRDVGKIANFIQLVRDDDDRPPCVGQSAQRRVQRARLPGGEHRGRLVQDHDTRVAVQRPRDLDPLALTNAQRRDPRVPGDRRANLPRYGLGLRPSRPQVEAPPLPARLSPEHDVLERSQHIDQREVLLHHGHTARERFGRRVRGELSAVDTGLPFIGHEEPGRDAQKRALSRTILADHRVNTAAFERQARPLYRVNRAETLVDLVDLERRHAPNLSRLLTPPLTMRHPLRHMVTMRSPLSRFLLARVPLASVAITLLGACASDPPPAPLPQPTLASTMTGSLPPDPVADAGVDAAPLPTAADAIRNALASPDRDPADLALDAQRHSAEMLSFFGIAPGQRVAELAAGGGYTTELLARVVGDGGEVWGENPRFILDKFAAKPWNERLAKPVMLHVRRVDQELDAPLPSEARNLGAVLMVLFYHDTVWLKADRAKMNKAVFDALKSGGVYGIVDHSGRPGTGATEAQTLHRIEEKLVIDEVTKAGFKLAGEADFLRNPSDTRDWNDSPMAAGAKRGTSDRFALKFVKP